MADIIKVDYTDATATLEALASMPMQLSVQTWSTALPDIVAGLVEEIGKVLYIVDTGDVTPTGWTVAVDNYLMLTPTATNATATWSTTIPTWNSANKGYYTSTSKCIGRAIYDGSSDWQWYRNPSLNNLHLKDLLVDSDVSIGNDLRVENDATIVNDLTVVNDLAVQQNLRVPSGYISGRVACADNRYFNVAGDTHTDVYNYISLAIDNQYGHYFPARGVYYSSSISYSIMAVYITDNSPSANVATIHVCTATGATASFSFVSAGPTPVAGYLSICVL